jgi:hypothetical protein
MRAEWIGMEFDTAEFSVSAEDIVAFARAVGEIEPRFTEPGHPDFQAPPTFPSKFVSRRVLPDTFPKLGGNGFDAGKSVECHQPVRPGDRLIAHSKIADIYEKTGRSGPMVFIVHRMEFTNQADELLAIVDWRMVTQPDPSKWKSARSKA